MDKTRILLFLVGLLSFVNIGYSDANLDIDTITKNKDSYYCANVIGSSMEIHFNRNSSAIIKKVDYTELKVGQLVAYINPDGKHIVHTLVNKTDLGWQAKGTSNKKIDPTLITDKNLIGIVYVILNDKIQSENVLYAMSDS